MKRFVPGSMCRVSGASCPEWITNGIVGQFPYLYSCLCGQRPARALSLSRVGKEIRQKQSFVEDKVKCADRRGRQRRMRTERSRLLPQDRPRETARPRQRGSWGKWLTWGNQPLVPCFFSKATAPAHKSFCLRGPLFLYAPAAHFP